jgi:hypothetical protein
MISQVSYKPTGIFKWCLGKMLWGWKKLTSGLYFLSYVHHYIISLQHFLQHLFSGLKNGIMKNLVASYNLKGGALLTMSYFDNVDNEFLNKYKTF